ncbi:hypothetical protein [Limosilactobacillus reuteri]|uniref:hypothetical protein n=1 Tax=Limosilactobacillus reuteri TaxID=1598 RepID=UPI001CDD7D6E|nr:hypothetical protein [Limosilactobacillus reuteri]
MAEHRLVIMSLFPVATGWINAEPHSRAAAYFYFLIFAVWGISFYVMVAVFAHDNPKNSKRILQMLQPRCSLFELTSLVIGVVVIYWLPIMALIILGINIIFWLAFPPKGSDKLQ